MKKEVWEWIRSITIAVVLALVVRFFLIEPFMVDGGSMYPTLKDQERLIVNKLVYRFDPPQPGDIIVFEYAPGTDFVKRVIGVGGDWIEIRDGRVYRNSVPLEEPYLDEGMDMPDYGPVEVPPGFLFVMGDYRRNSKDSRDPSVGFVSLEKVKGRAMLVLWPPWEARLIKTQAAGQ